MGRERIQYFRENGINMQIVQRQRQEGIEVVRELVDRNEQIQEQYERIRNVRYNKRYKMIKENTRPVYLSADQGTGTETRRKINTGYAIRN